MTNFITNEDHTEASQKFPRHVKHTTTAWPNLIFPFHHEVNIGIFFLFSVVFHSLMLHLVGQIEKEQNPKLVAQMVPDLIFFLSSHLVKQGEVSRHTTLSVLDRFLPFFSFTPPRCKEQKSPTHCSIGPRPVSFVLHHLVAQSRSPRRIAQTVHTTMWPDKQIGVNSINKFLGPQLAKQNEKQNSSQTYSIPNS